ncbi:hypothetical protein AVEN_89664-1 [Araneus ventricosus]|uniref:Uncharacterized protein n=1 Tax=Araneus ventricosus TaxID=182803 RepID=A0A4Y2EXP6_ARAVE|nr:hypothetical protein AVEN_89664-1 [Araneus ventricosus]
MQDGTASHIATLMKQLLNLDFGNVRIISRHFPTAWLLRLNDQNPCHFWLWGYLKDVVYRGPIANFTELKNRITQHIHNITTETLRSVVEHAAFRFQLIGENGGAYRRTFLKQVEADFFFLMVSSVFTIPTVSGLGQLKTDYFLSAVTPPCHGGWALNKECHNNMSRLLISFLKLAYLLNQSFLASYHEYNDIYRSIFELFFLSQNKFPLLHVYSDEISDHSDQWFFFYSLLKVLLIIITLYYAQFLVQTFKCDDKATY